MSKILDEACRAAVLPLVLFGLLAAACGGDAPTVVAPTPPKCATTDGTLTAGSFPSVTSHLDVCREYLVHVPPSYDGSRPFPVVIVMHGYTGDPRGMQEWSGMSWTADANGFIAVYPGGIDRAWDLTPGGRDIRFLRALIETVQSRANVDRRRIYVTGHSMGGAMSTQAACDLADVVAAAAPVSGGHVYPLACSPARPIPLLVIHGSADPVVPAEGRSDIGWPPISSWVPAWAPRNGCSTTPVVRSRGDVVETEWPNCAGGAELRLMMVQGLDHGWWGGANDELWRFFARHTL